MYSHQHQPETREFLIVRGEAEASNTRWRLGRSRIFAFRHRVHYV